MPFRLILFTALSLIPAMLQGQQRLSLGDKSLNPQPFSVQLKSLEIDPTLDKAALLSVPPYTLGSEITLHWNRDSVAQNLIPAGSELLTFEVSGFYDAGEQPYEFWGFSNGSEITFAELPEGIDIGYSLRYWVQRSSGDYGVSFWSDTVYSRQDIRPPRLDRALTYISGLNTIGNQNWIVDDLLSIHVEATDSLAGVVELFKMEIDGMLAPPFQFTNPKVRVAADFDYRLNMPSKTPFVLKAWVQDAAKQTSDTMTYELLWWPGEEGKDLLTCFPNPFSVESGSQPLKIMVGAPDVRKARIFDPFGNLVVVLTKHPDEDFFSWDGRNGDGETVASGGYICVADNLKDVYCKIAVIR